MAQRFDPAQGTYVDVLADDQSVAISDVAQGTRAQIISTAPVSDSGQHALAVRVVSQLGAGSGGGAASTVKLVDAAGSNLAAVSALGAVRVDGSAVTQPVSAASLPLPAGAAQEHVSAASYHAVRQTDGSSFYDARQIRALTSADQVTVANASLPVTGTFWQATQPVSGTVAVSNLPASQTVAGAVAVSGTDGVASSNATVRAHNGSSVLYVRDPAVLGALSELSSLLYELVDLHREDQ